MTDPLEQIQQRLGWINRAVLAAAAIVLVVLGVFAWRLVHRAPAAPAVTPAASAAHAAGTLPLTAAHPASAVLAASGPNPNLNPASAAASQPAAAPLAAQPASAPQSVAPRPAASRALPASPRGAAKLAPAAASASAALPPMAAPASAPVSTSMAAPASAPVHALQAKAAPAGHARAGQGRASRSTALCSRAGWYVQVGAFAEARRFAYWSRRLHRAGLPHCTSGPSAKGLQLLLIGPYADRERAEHVRSRLRAELREHSYLRHLHGG